MPQPCSLIGALGFSRELAFVFINIPGSFVGFLWIRAV
jgi:hypothetical protein